MRKLILTQGVPGSGKSSWIEKNGLGPYTISVDALRLLNGAPVMDLEGSFGIDQNLSKRAWAMALELVDSRMRRGDLIVVDATHCTQQAVKNYRDMAEKHRYEIILARFDIDPGTAKHRNANRDAYKIVPDKVIDRMYTDLKGFRAPRAMDIREMQAHEVLDVLCSEFEVDVSQYEKVVFFGDLQGTYTPLKEYFEKHPYNPKWLYVFCGDYVDRGLENHLSLQFCLDNYSKPNFIFIEGNHEHHPHCWANGYEIVSEEFKNATQAQLEQYGIDKNKVKRFNKALRQLVILRHGADTFTVTHAGVSRPLYGRERLALPAMQAIKGVGRYEASIDEAWEANAWSSNYQVHGHRNAHNRPLLKTQTSFNLESGVEFGGHLSILVWTPATREVEPILIQNTYYKDLVRHDSFLQPLKDDTLTAQLRANPMIQEKDQGYGISSFNFKREAFYGGVWNGQTVRARGLFVDTETNEVVARSYEKFFNLDEREETKEELLRQTLKFPAKMTLKENGFLGIAGYSKKIDKMIIASKSTMLGEYRDYFANILVGMYPGDVVEKMAGFLKEHNASAVFEVIDPVNDPHIVQYDRAYVVLLDVFENKIEMVKRDDLRSQLSSLCGFQLPASWTVNSWQELEVYSKSGKKNIEGFVVEDSLGFMFKIKLPWYNFWKQMRGVKERMEKGIWTGFKKEPTPAEEMVAKFMLENPDLISKSIIEVRNAFVEKTVQTAIKEST